VKKNKHPKSEETKKKMSIAQKNKIVSEETKEKLRKINLGKIISEETKKKMSLKQKGIPRKGVFKKL